MSATFVNKSEAQSQPAVTSLDTPALALVAGNFSLVCFRCGGVALADIAVTDTAGNTYQNGGYVLTSASGRLYFFYAANCLGHAANVVHVAFTSSAFVHATAAQFSGMPASVACDFAALNQGSGGTTISVTPSSIYADQLVIAAADLTSSGHSTIAPGVFTLLGTGTYGPGVGSDDVWYSINSTGDFNGSVDCTCTFSGGFATSSKSMLVAIFRQRPSGVPVGTPLAAQTPCTPQANVANGGKAKAGCNVGGVGGGHEYDVADGVGDVPQHDDPDDGETLTGEDGVVLEPWLELDHVDYPSDDVTTYRRAFEELADDDTYQGGRKEAGLLTIGRIEHALSNEQGGFEAATVDIQLSDIRDRLIRELADDQDLDLDEFRIKLASDAARAAGTVPRTLLRGVVQASTLESMLKARLTGVDWLFSDFGPFGPNRKDPNWTFGDLAGAAPDMTSDTKAQAIPLLYGEKSDEGAVDPLTLAAAAKGLLPGFYLGMFDLGSVLPDTPTTTGRTLEELVAIMNQLVADEVPPVSWVDTIGFDLGTDDITNMLAATGDTIPTTFEALASYLGGEDVKQALLAGTTAAPTDTIWGFIATGLGPWFRYTGVYGSDLGGGDPQKTHDRTKLDPASRSDILLPGVKWPFAVPYMELTNPDTGRTFWLTGAFVRGPLLEDHLNGVVTLAFNAIGTEENGDGSGLPIMRVEDAKQHRLENHWINQWSSGPYVNAVTFPQFNDGVPKVRSSSFLTRQNFFKDQLGGEGLLVSWYADRQQSTLDVVRQWNRDTESRLGVNQHGQVVDWGFDESVDTSAWPRLDHVAEIFGPIVRTAGEERENVVSGSCDWDPDFEKQRAGPFTFQSAAGIQKYKNRIKQGEIIESQILDSPDHFGWILQRRLARLQFGTTLIEVTGPLNPWANYDVGQGVLVTSEDGPGPDGYVDHEFIILRRAPDVVQGLMTFTLWDVRDLLALYAGDTPPILDVVYDDVTGEIVLDTDTAEIVYADAS